MADIDGSVIEAVVEEGYSSTKHRTIDGGLAQLTIAVSDDTTKPTIANFSPAVGTPLNSTQPVTFDVTDETGLVRALVLVTLGSETFLVHDGDIFRPGFSNYSTRTAIAGGFRYTVRPNGGWTKPPTFEVHAVDTSGNEAT